MKAINFPFCHLMALPKKLNSMCSVVSPVHWTSGKTVRTTLLKGILKSTRIRLFFAITYDEHVYNRKTFRILPIRVMFIRTHGRLFICTQSSHLNQEIRPGLNIFRQLSWLSFTYSTGPLDYRHHWLLSVLLQCEPVMHVQYKQMSEVGHMNIVNVKTSTCTCLRE